MHTVVRTARLVLVALAAPACGGSPAATPSPATTVTNLRPDIHYNASYETRAY